MRRTLLLILLLLAGVESLSAQTTTSGLVTDYATGTPVGTGWVGLVRKSTVDSLYGAPRVWPDLLIEVDDQGVWYAELDDTDPSWHEFYAYSISPLQHDEIYPGQRGDYGLPHAASFSNPSVQVFSSQVTNSNIIFRLSPNKSSLLMPMRDGVNLSANVYSARRLRRDPVILVRTPYGKEAFEAYSLYTIFGYSVVVQDTRGRGDSEGVDDVFRSDSWGTNQDGYDTIEWVAQRSFCNGDVGMIGASALAINEYFAAGAAPPSLVCCYTIEGSGDLYEWMFSGGVFHKGMVEDFLERQGSTYFLDDIADHTSQDSWWDIVDLDTRFRSVQVPMLHVAGWFDPFADPAMRAFSMLQEAGGPGAMGRQRLVIGPWSHLGFFEQEQGDLVFPDQAADEFDDSLDVTFFDYWMKDIDAGYSTAPAVRYYVMGDVDDPAAPGNEWRETDVWPVPSTPKPFFFQGNGKLVERRGLDLSRPRAISNPGPVSFPGIPAKPAVPRRVSYLYDPDDPAPSLGSFDISADAGPVDQRPVEARNDVKTFTTDVLTEPLEVTGAVRCRLYVTSSALDTDFIVRLTDVYPDGRSILIQEGAIQARRRLGLDSEDLLVPGRVHPIDVELHSTSIVFAPGHRIRVSVTSSSVPHYEPNPNTGEPFRQHTGVVKARNTIECSPRYPSRVILPVVR